MVWKVGPGGMVLFNVASMGDFMHQSGPPAGYFIAGSSLATMNGLYVKLAEEQIPAALKGVASEVFMHDNGNWILARVRSSNGFEDEWVIIDHNWKDRFGAAGSHRPPNTGNGWFLISSPRATSVIAYFIGWHHLHRAPRQVSHAILHTCNCV